MRDKKNTFKKGQTPWNKGLNGEKYKEHFSEGFKGTFKDGSIPWNKGTKGIMKSWNKGKKLDKYPQMGFQKGHKNYNSGGNKWSKESRIKFSSTQQGINIEDWKGFKSTLNHRLRTSAKYKVWRNMVFLRDNFTCQNENCKFCNNKIGVLLNSHHKKPIAEFPELIFKIDNGITYCAEFHLMGNLHKGITRKQDNFIMEVKRL